MVLVGFPWLVSSGLDRHLVDCARRHDEQWESCGWSRSRDQRSSGLPSIKSCQGDDTQQPWRTRESEVPPRRSLQTLASPVRVAARPSGKVPPSPRRVCTCLVMAPTCWRASRPSPNRSAPLPAVRSARQLSTASAPLRRMPRGASSATTRPPPAAGSATGDSGRLGQPTPLALGPHQSAVVM